MLFGWEGLMGHGDLVAYMIVSIWLQETAARHLPDSNCDLDSDSDIFACVI
jgi:hypothetical protein